MSASSLAEVMAARGGLDGGEGSPWSLRTSGTPLGPAGAGSGVMEASETRRGIYNVGRGENVGLASNNLAMAITTTVIVVFYCWATLCWIFATVAVEEPICGVCARLGIVVNLTDLTGEQIMLLF